MTTIMTATIPDMPYGIVRFLDAEDMLHAMIKKESRVEEKTVGRKIRALEPRHRGRLGADSVSDKEIRLDLEGAAVLFAGPIIFGGYLDETFLLGDL